MEPKAKITQEEITNLYEIIPKEITGDSPGASSSADEKDDTTPSTEPEFLTEEEEAFDIAMHGTESSEKEE